MLGCCLAAAHGAGRSRSPAPSRWSAPPRSSARRHEGIPFEIDYSAGAYQVVIDGSGLTGLVLTLDPITIVFADGRDALLFTLDGGDGALSRHEAGPSGLKVATFTGPCVTG
jgi:hypothetical protein